MYKPRCWYACFFKELKGTARVSAFFGRQRFTEFINSGKDFFGGYSFLSQGPLPINWAHSLGNKRGLWGMTLRQEMTRYNHQAGLKIVGEVLPQESNRVELADEVDELGLRIPKTTFGYCDNDQRLHRHATAFMTKTLSAAGGMDIWSEDGTAHLMGTCRMGNDPQNSVVDPNGRTWDIANVWICDESLFPTCGGVNPSLTIQAMACRIADRIKLLVSRGELNQRSRGRST